MYKNTLLESSFLLISSKLHVVRPSDDYPQKLRIKRYIFTNIYVFEKPMVIELFMTKRKNSAAII